MSAVRCSWCSSVAVYEAWILHWNEWVPVCADHLAFHVPRELRSAVAGTYVDEVFPVADDGEVSS